MNISFRDRLHYQFDNTMAKGPIALIGWLSLLSVALIVLVSLIIQTLGLDPSGRGFMDLLWAGLMHAMDAGSIGGDSGSWSFLFAMLATTIGGIFILSTLIGVLTTGLESRLEELRKGRSLVAEENHTVILGWSPQIFTLLTELMIANANHARACIAILAEKDAVEMQDEIRSKIGNTGRTRIVCRSGAPIDIADLKIVNPSGARSIIVLAPEDENPDAYVIKTILALTCRPQRLTKPYHLVAFIRDASNLAVARMVGGNEVELVSASDLIARITAQTCRQSGLSVAYTELLDFGGDEIYFKEEPTLVGNSFGQALMAYEDSTVIGLRTQTGHIQLNPSMQTLIGHGDKLIVIASDDDKIQLSGVTTAPVEQAAIRTANFRPSVPERTLILGWNERAMAIIRELDNYVGAGSIVKIVADAREHNEHEHDEHERIAGFTTPGNGQPTFQNLSIHFQAGNITDRRTLDALTSEQYDHIIVLSEATSSATDAQQIDARTLITLLHLRDIADKQGQHFSIVSEMLDIRNRELAQVTRADDFVVSDKLISLMLAQISENKELARVFQDLFDPEGAEIYFKPVCDYVTLGKPVNFYTVLEAARQRGEIAIGYRLHDQAHASEHAYGVKLNPHKSQPVTFDSEDRIILLAES